MKRYFLLSVFFTGIAFGLVAQESVYFKVQPGTSDKKELRVTQLNSDGLNDFLLHLNVQWITDDGKNNVVLTFDRSNSEGEGLLLCFPLMRYATRLDNVKACNSLSRRVWKGKGARSIRYMNYFLQSDDVEKDYNDCYRFVAVNNEEEFDLGSIGDKEKLSLSLTNLYVMREEKRPWYYLSKRDMKLEYRAKPIDVEILLERPPADPCKQTDNVKLLEEIEGKIIELEAAKERAKDVVKTNNNCAALLKEIFKDVKSNYPEEQLEWSNSNCSDIQTSAEEYKKIYNEIFSIRCKKIVAAPTVTPPITNIGRCPDLKKINKQLMNLQMNIYAKKKDGKNYEKERQDFLTIKNNTDKKISSICDQKLLESYRSFCAYIEDALNN